MKKNIGTADRLLRLFLAVIIAVLILIKQLTGIPAIVLGIFAVLFTLTSFASYSPLYPPLKISTRKKK